MPPTINNELCADNSQGRTAWHLRMSKCVPRLLIGDIRTNNRGPQQLIQSPLDVHVLGDLAYRRKSSTRPQLLLSAPIVFRPEIIDNLCAVLLGFCVKYKWSNESWEPEKSKLLIDFFVISSPSSGAVNRLVIWFGLASMTCASSWT